MDQRTLAVHFRCRFLTSHPDTILSPEPPDRTGCVYGMGDRPVLPENEVGGVDDLATDFVERACL